MPTAEEIKQQQDEEAAAEAKRKEEESAQALDAKIAETVNKAITGHLRRLKTPSPEEIDKQIEERVAARMKELSQHQPKPKPGEGTDPEVAAMQKKMAEMEAQLVIERERREASEKKARDDSHSAYLRKTLEAAGITGIHNDAVSALLLRGGKVRENESGELSYFDGDVELELGKGITKFTASPEGKAFIAPVGSGGSGGAKPTVGRTPKSNDSDQRIAVIATELFPGVVQ